MSKRNLEEIMNRTEHCINPSADSETQGMCMDPSKKDKDCEGCKYNPAIYKKPKAYLS